jgi:hypothetical protein
MNYWWVNQNQTYRHEVQGGFLWSPKTRKDGGRNQFYDNMSLVKPGDLIFSFADTLIKAIGVATGPAQTADKPDFGNSGENWQNEGWLVPVEFTELEIQSRPKDFISELRPHLAEKYSPLQATGDGNQGVYLASISQPFAQILMEKAKISETSFVANIEAVDNFEADQEQKAVEGRTDIGPTQKAQLVQSRRGQGIFKANVRLNETKCRVTGLSDPRFLIASHIKPWSKCSDKEKLDGCNGLLLSPHIDRLFDKGWISFTDQGDIIFSSKIGPSVLDLWGIADKQNVGRFSPEQCVYLEFHRNSVFRR